MKLNTKTKSGFVGCASSVMALSLVAMAMLCPGVDGVFAATDCSGDLSGNDAGKGCASENITVGFEVKDAATSGDYAVKTGNLNVSFVVNPFIEISQNPNNVDITEDDFKEYSKDHPEYTDAAKISTKSTQFAVRTNSSTGFDVYVSADDGNLSPADSSNPAAINPITASNTALAAFGANTWGYAVTDSSTNPSTYRKINDEDDESPAYAKSGFSSTATALKLHFGTKVDDTLPADTYSTTVKVSAVLSGAEVASLANNESAE